MRGTKCFTSSGSVIAMVVVQIIVTGLQLLSRVILAQGSTIFSIITYRNIVAAMFMTPVAIFMERDTLWTITWQALGWAFLSSFFGISFSTSLFYYGLQETTATYATIFLNLIPTATLLLSLAFRLEQLRVNTRVGIIKVVGAIISLGGALAYRLYHGADFYVRAPHHGIILNMLTHAFEPPHWVCGTIFLAASSLGYAAWFLVQAKLSQVFPAKYWSTALTCIIGAVQSAVASIIFDRSVKAWRLGWNLQFVTVLYSGIFATAINNCLIFWAVGRHGPTYPPIFNPLSLIFLAISEGLLFSESISAGNITGMVMIILGSYALLWSRRRERRTPSVPETRQTENAAESAA